MNRRYMRRSATLVMAVFMLTMALVYLAPLPNTVVIARLAPLLHLRKGRAVAVAGNSVVMHVSVCDSDKRPLHSVISADLSRRVDNLAFDGQPFEQSLNYITIALRRDSVSGGIFFLSPSSLTVRVLPDLQTQLFLHLAASGRFHANSLLDRFHQHAFIAPLPSENNQPFVYDHVQYPDYNGIKEDYFTPEKAAMGCPETLGRNLHFIEAAYWRAYLAQPVRQDHLEDLSTLQQIAAHLNKPFLVVLMPVDYDDMRRLNPSLSEQVQDRVQAILSGMRQRNLNILDLTGSLPADDFADRWSASGHLVEEGRYEVGARTADAYRALSRAGSPGRREAQD